MTFKNHSLGIAASLLVGAFLFTACSKEKTALLPEETISFSAKNVAKTNPPKGTIFFALTSTNELVRYSSGNPLAELGNVSISGLQSMEQILAIDFRPATGQLYGVSNQSRVYVINQNNGVAVAVSTMPFTPALNSTDIGMDFNPTVDRIRIVTSNDQNLRINPETGLVVGTDVAINPSSATVNAVAYTNNVAGATTTTLYDIDVASDKLFIQTPPNNGTLVEVGMLGVQALGEAGFDISADNSVAIAALFGRGMEDEQTEEESNGNKYRFYYINLATGAASNAGKTDRVIIGLAIPTNPVAYAVNQSNNLLIFNPTQASTIASKTISGLQMGEMILGIDMRPVSSQLYALGSSNRIYTINLANGMATVVGTMPFTTALSGTSFGFDFNPTVDRIRVVSNTGQNLRLNPITGGIASVDPPLNPGTPAIDAAGYTNSFVGTTTTTLYDVDYVADKLYIQNPANAGTLIEVGALGINVEASNGFDIGGRSNNAWGIFTVGTSNAVYSINLTTGQATQVMSFPSFVRGFAIGLGF